MDLVLPQGIIISASEVYTQLASLPVVSSEVIRHYWNAYTVISKKTGGDPTHLRLENFWWHVWGSNRRNLSGPALARLFQDISTGPTAVPLVVPKRSREILERSKVLLEQINAEGHGSASTQQPEGIRGEGRDAMVKMKAPTPSSSRPPPPHPILKKHSAPVPGPRHTARFASPPRVGEGESNGGATTSITKVVPELSTMPPPPLPTARKTKTTSESPTTMKLPSTDNAEKTTAPTAPSGGKASKPVAARKRVMATTKSAKRRPVMPRRTSSQSSTASNTQQRMVPATADQSHQSTRSAAVADETFQESPPSIAASSPTSTLVASVAEIPASAAVDQSSQSSQGGSESSQDEQRTSSSKAAGKRPARPTQRSSSGGILTVTIGSQERRPLFVSSGFLPARSPSLSRSERSVSTTREATRRNSVEKKPRRAPVAGFVADNESGSDTPSPARTRTTRVTKDPIVGSPRPPPRVPLFSQRMSGELPYSSPHAMSHRLSGEVPNVQALTEEPTTQISDTTVQGQFDSDVIATSSLVEARDIPDFVSRRSRPSPSLLQEPFSPTPPSSTPTIPFGRSKSQLTLLLAKDNHRKVKETR
ncbi:hypothetical protein SMACR_05028 [Sordaria macrospora]|uniref:WGS project CABT00000000 data, contig 2.8 n=2 Tax=Sordaria macrospora TaxID=5147 RepID=F7VUS4_SORMK|nr:uncharacterized protein SMAC_05028 [Sordaria macrospora k-hell]KAA8636234.1 hypothetical protein SMACR_05028 [Sordaria macrospora]WPJ57430.1 hypothetical protein SMAC4_05028 [Sordaria macrospora]CCC09270.1 unnamed protein product [Sordaria macrospora k-hell]